MARQERTPLPKVCAGKEFPAGKDRFKLGGHASEVALMHIGFAKKDGARRLDAIYMRG